MKHTDNLQPEGKFAGREPEQWAPGERAPVVKRPDNLKPEGKFQEKAQVKWQPAEKATAVRHSDNLKSIQDSF